MACNYESSLLTALQGQFNAQRDAVLNALDTKQQSNGMRTKDFVADLISWDQYDQAMQAVLAPYLYAVIVEVGQEAAQDIGLQPSEFDPFTPNVIRYQDERSIRIAGDVNDETEKQLRASITEGLTAGESSHQVRARIEKIFGFALTERADLIAQTEVARAQTFGDVEAWSQSELVSEKEWYTAHDERVCKFCGPMDGRRIALNDNFFDKGDVQVEEATNRKGEKTTVTYKHSYDAVPGAPLHPRCRCVLLPVRK